MKKIICSLIFFLLSLIVEAQTYKTAYKISYIQSLTNNSVRTETGLLIIKANQESVHATKNYFKRVKLVSMMS